MQRGRGVCNTGDMGLVSGQQAGCRWDQGVAMGAALPRYKAQAGCVGAGEV